MKHLSVGACGLLAFVACAGDDHNPPLSEPCHPNCGGTGGPDGPDDPDPLLDAAPGPKTVKGKVCVVFDFTKPEQCSDKTPGGLDIDLTGVRVTEFGTGNVTTVNAAGDYELTVEDDSLLETGFGQSGYFATLTSTGTDGFGGSVAPLIDAAMRSQVLLGLAVVDDGTRGGAVVYARKGALPAVGAKVETSQTFIAPAYDTNTPGIFSIAAGQTGPAGTALLLGLSPSPATAEVTVTGPGGSPIRIINVAVVPGRMTFVVVDL